MPQSAGEVFAVVDLVEDGCVEEHTLTCERPHVDVHHGPLDGV